MNIKEIIIKKLEEEIYKNISKIGNIPYYLIPKVNESNDCAYPYVDIGDDGIIYIVIREKGIEYERSFCINRNDAIFKLLKKITFELAVEEEKKNSDYSLDRIKDKQREFLKTIDPSWNIE